MTGARDCAAQATTESIRTSATDHARVRFRPGNKFMSSPQTGKLSGSLLFLASRRISLSDNPLAKRFCIVGLQADTAATRTCPPEGGRYQDQNQILAQTHRPRFSR